MAEYRTIDEYIETFPAGVQKKLTELRNVIRELAPDAVEKISYQMPTFYLNGNLVHFAAYSKHIGFYPTPSGITNFEQDIAKFKHAKGSIQFPIEDPLPLDLIIKIVNFRIKENLSKKKK